MTAELAQAKRQLAIAFKGGSSEAARMLRALRTPTVATNAKPTKVKSVVKATPVKTTKNTKPVSKTKKS